MSREENMIYCKISKTMCTSAWWLPFIATPVCPIPHIMDTNMTRALNKGLAAFRCPYTFNSCRQSAHSGDSYSSQIPSMLGSAPACAVSGERRERQTPFSRENKGIGHLHHLSGESPETLIHIKLLVPRVWPTFV